MCIQNCLDSRQTWRLMPFETLCPLSSWGQCSLKLAPHSRHEKHAENTANKIPDCKTSILCLPLDFSVSYWWTYCAFLTLKLGSLICKWKKQNLPSRLFLGIERILIRHLISELVIIWWHNDLLLVLSEVSDDTWILGFKMKNLQQSHTSAVILAWVPPVCSVSPMGRPLSIDMESLYEAAAAFNNTMSNFTFWISYSDFFLQNSSSRKYFCFLFMFLMIYLIFHKGQTSQLLKCQ